MIREESIADSLCSLPPEEFLKILFTEMEMELCTISMADCSG